MLKQAYLELHSIQKSASNIQSYLYLFYVLQRKEQSLICRCQAITLLELFSQSWRKWLLELKNFTRTEPFDDGTISIRSKAKMTVGYQRVASKKDCYKDGGLGTLCNVWEMKSFLNTLRINEMLCEAKGFNWSKLLTHIQGRIQIFLVSVSFTCPKFIETHCSWSILEA